MKEILVGVLRLATKIPVRDVLVTVCVSSWFLLLAPDSMSDFLGLRGFRDSQRTIIGLSVLVSTIILMLLLVGWIWNCIHDMLVYSGRDAKRRLDAVGEWNRSLVRQLYEIPSHSQKLPLQDANVQALLSENIIINARLGDAIGFDCVLQPWVVRYLNEHRDYLEAMKKFEKPFTCESPFV